MTNTYYSLDQYYAYIARIQSSSLMDSQAGDTSLLADRLQQWNIERLTLGFKLIEECEGDARLNYIEDMLVPNWQIVCLETLKDTNYLQAPPIQKAFTKVYYLSYYDFKCMYIVNFSFFRRLLTF
jgi:hypothetical protein